MPIDYGRTRRIPEKTVNMGFSGIMGTDEYRGRAALRTLPAVAPEGLTSMHGQDISLPRRVERLCPNCGAQFSVMGSVIRKGGGSGTYCSSACRFGGATLVDRLNSNIERLPDGCWCWTGTLSKAGYGRICHGGERHYAHRVAYECWVGPIPTGMVIDHLCRNRACVNPAHLETVTPRTNAIRGEAPTVILHRKGVCARGHSLTEETRFHYKDGRPAGCKRCQEERQRALTTRPRAKLTASDVVDIRARLLAGESCAALGRSYGVNRGTISRISTGERWAHVIEPPA